MNFQKVQRKNRKAISPVLATVILIAITLIAAVAIAGFVFGLFGSFTSTAQVQASVTSCNFVSIAVGEQCSLVLTNSGNANTLATSSCSITTKGATTTGAYAFAAPSASLTVPSGGTAYGTCTAVIADPGAGVQVTGSVILGNGGNALFSGSSSN